MIIILLKIIILSEIDIKEKDLNKDIRIINTYKQFIREDGSKLKIDIVDDYKNEEEIKNNCEIKINNKIIPFKYFYQFK